VRIAKPILLVTTPIGVVFGLREAWRLAGPAMAVLMAAMLAVVGGFVWMTVRRIRRALRERIGQWWPEVRSTLGSLRAGNKLGLLIGGSVAAEILFAIALGLFAFALGTQVGLAQLLLINISVSLLASFVPVPGGVGGCRLGGLPGDSRVLVRVDQFAAPRRGVGEERLLGRYG